VLRILCVIPVRGGSKGLLRKNLSEIVDGVSLLEWTARQALDCYPAENIVVTTEDDELSRIAKICGVSVVERPEELALDDTTTSAVVDHLLDFLDPDATRFDAVAILQVTSPLRETADIRYSIEMINSGAYDSVVSAYEAMTCHPAKLYLIDETSVTPLVKPVLGEYEFSRRQDLPKAFRRNGAIFLVTRDHYARTGQLWGGRTGLVIMPKSRSVDIDSVDDLNKAKQFLRQTNTDVLQ
jgi:CMP-N-acetylneuraminic acid synthetase